MEPAYKVTFSFLLEYQLQNSIRIEEMTVILHLNIGVIRLVMTRLNLCDEEVLTLSKRFLYHLFKAACKDWIYFV